MALICSPYHPYSADFHGIRAENRGNGAGMALQPLK
jgi:hypothetical protein